MEEVDSLKSKLFAGKDILLTKMLRWSVGDTMVIQILNVKQDLMKHSSLMLQLLRLLPSPILFIGTPCYTEQEQGNKIET